MGGGNHTRALVKSRWSLQSHVFEGSPQNVVLSDAFCCLPQKSAVSCDLTVALQMFSDTAAAVKHGGVSRSPLPARDQPQGCRRSADGSRLPSRSWGGRGGSRGGQSRALYPRVRPLAPRRSTGPMATPAASCERGGHCQTVGSCVCAALSLPGSRGLPVSRRAVELLASPAAPAPCERWAGVRESRHAAHV